MAFFCTISASRRPASRASPVRLSVSRTGSYPSSRQAAAAAAREIETLLADADLFERYRLALLET